MELKDAWKHYENTKDTSHGVEHIKAVLDNARIIASNYKELNPEDVEYAAVLHDIAREGDCIHGTNDHEIRGVSMALPYIEHLPPHRRDTILDAIVNHRSSGKPETLLGQIIADADRLDSVHRHPIRSYDYYRSKGDDDATALRNSYWNLRHRKLNTLNTRANNFHTPEGQAIYKGQVQKLDTGTRTFKAFLTHIPGVDQNIEFKEKQAAIEDVGAYHFSRKGFEPNNLLNKPLSEQVKILVTDEKSLQTLKQRHTTEEVMHAIAGKKLHLKNMVKHPLYFKLGGKPDANWKDSVRYRIHPEVLEHCTYTIGDSLHKFRVATRKDNDVQKVFNSAMLTKEEVDELPKKEMLSPTGLSQGAGQYIEGQLWAPYTIKGKTIMLDKQAGIKDKTESFLRSVRDFMHRSKSYL